MLIAGFPAGPWGTNCYVLATGPGAECLVVDPGKDAAAGVAEVVREHGLKPVSVLVTHGHIDHMWCVAPVAGSYDATAYIHPEDRHLLSDPMAAMSPETAGMLLGGKYGEMSTLSNYMFQSFNFRSKSKLRPFYSLVASITAEELGLLVEPRGVETIMPSLGYWLTKWPSM